MADIATRLVALGQPPEHLRWLELPGLPEKGDILDWIQEGHSADELHNLMDSATVYPISVNVSGISVPFLSTDSNNPKPLPNNESGDIGNCVNSVPEWENPIPLESGDRTGPSFPVEALPDWLRDWVIAESQSTQTPTDLAGVLALGVLSACLANAATVEARKGWRESLSLYILVGLPSGERKSPVFRDATRPLEDLEAADIQAAKPDIAKKQAERDLLERQLADATASAAKGKGKTLLDVQEAAEALEKCRVPSAPRFLVEDVTIERIATILAGQPAQRLAVMSAEGGFFTTISGRYSEHPAFDLLLKAYTGEPFRVDRVGRPPDILKTPALSLVMAVQPSVIKDLAEFRPFKDRGLLARILFVLPQSFVGKRAPDPPEMPDTIQERYYQRIADLFRVGLQYAALADDIPPVTLYLTTEARQALRAYMTEIEPQLAMNGSLGPLAGWGNKLAGTMLRIAGLLHCAEQPLEDRTIDKEMIDRAIVLTRYLTGHAQVAFSMMESPPETHAAQIILDYLRSHGLHEFTKRQLYRELRAIFKNSRDIDGPLAVLSDHAFIRIKKEEEDPSSPRRGRPPSPVFEFTPLDRIDTIDKNPENAGSTRISQGSQFVDRNGTKIPATLTEMSDPPLEEVKVVGARF
ncbi:MAG: YfjI family protein [Firmicutes bacterium]|nr:YfjI family protein [Bacillota bacterium]